ncbi:MAG TPA: hypothetical protein VGK71_07945, partial [Nitrospirota bacterium]
QRIGKIYELVDEVVLAGRERIPTPKVNAILENALKGQPPGIHKGHRVKLFFMAQVAVSPPTFVVFSNRPEGVHFSYVRYLENRIRYLYPFAGNPIRIFLKKRGKAKEEEAGG